MISHLYKITHESSGRYYYGKHNGVSQKNTGKMSGLYWGSGKAIKDLIKKYGTDNLTYNILCYGSPEYIFELESKIVTKELIEEDLCLNLCEGGLGSPMKSEEQKLAQSKRMKGRLVGDLNPSKQKTVRDKLSKLHSGVGNPMYGKTPWNIGVTHTDEVKEAISKKNSKMQRFLSPEGTIVERLGLRAFSEEFGLSVHGLSMLNSGAYKHHKGWRKA